MEEIKELIELKNLIKNDAYAISFQTLAQYRNALIEHINSINSAQRENSNVSDNVDEKKKCHYITNKCKIKNSSYKGYLDCKNCDEYY